MKFSVVFVLCCVGLMDLLSLTSVSCTQKRQIPSRSFPNMVATCREADGTIKLCPQSNLLSRLNVGQSRSGYVSKPTFGQGTLYDRLNFGESKSGYTSKPIFGQGRGMTNLNDGQSRGMTNLNDGQSGYTSKPNVAPGTSMSKLNDDISRLMSNLNVTQNFGQHV